MSTAPRSEPPAGIGASVFRHAVGFALIAGCFLFADWVKRRLGLIIPGSVLGLFLLLGLLGARIIRLAWVEDAAKFLIAWLPVCFVTLYVGAAADRELWRQWGLTIALTLSFSLVLLWIFIGRFAQWLLTRKGPPAS